MNEQTLLALQKYEKKLHAKKWTVTVCVLIICLIDQIRGSAYGNLYIVANNFTGFAIAGIILIHYPIRAFLLPAHYIWAAVCLLGSIIFLNPLSPSFYTAAQWVTAAVNVWIYGHIAIQTFYHYYLRRKIPSVKWPLFAVWVVMMLGMIFSRNDSLWPLWFLVMFGCFYLTEYTRDEKECIFDGLMNGIILSFFLLQGFCVLYRFYGSVRYIGIFTNSNINALFFLITEAAVLGKWYRFHITGEKFYFEIMACIMNSLLICLCLMTICRVAFIVMLFNTALTVFLMFFTDCRYKLLHTALRISAVSLSVLLTFPAAFWCVRYVPVYFSSPMLLYNDVNWLPEEITPETFTPNDVRLASYENLIESILDRFEIIKEDQLFQFLKSEAEKPAFPNAVLIAKASAEDNPGSADREPIVRGSGASPQDPVFPDSNYITQNNVRLEIYKEYLRRTDFSGHRNAEVELWFTDSTIFPHAHNNIIQILYCFGWIPGILFGLLCFFSLIYYMFRCLTPKNVNCRLIICALLISSFLGFGMLDISCQFGQMSFTFFFLSLYYLFQKRGSRTPVSKDRQ